ncbi:PfkB family carbohydrate kinase [Thiorhodospira sibirica]|uniref:PfkB family carbohydrate kinase n=1 Tax=Thiorhodospira sibirica TaxID=154347 RepID=UPI00022C22CC|nr:PfkB family carbohydrate kinase [Thiorhodospira sibirica]
MARILAIGIATLDIIHEVDHYPAEDEELRALSQRISPGGNAVNTLRVLAQLGHQSHLAAVLAKEPDGQRLAASLTELGIDIAACHWQPGRTPCSYITLNQANGLRTILHYRDLAELKAEHLAQVAVEEYDWVHLEGRDVAYTLPMLKALRQRLVDQPISLEIEKNRADILQLADYADVVIFSRRFVQAQGIDDPAAWLHTLQPRHPDSLLLCPWGEQGAWGIDADNALIHQAAFAVDQVIDTLGAGDTFNAGVIDALASGQPLPQALRQACQLAGRKVAQSGFAGLSNAYRA